jgi:FtsH-binding integral membrane protein
MDFLRRYFVIVCALVGAAWFSYYVYTASQFPGSHIFSTLAFWLIVLVPVCLGFLIAVAPSRSAASDSGKPGADATKAGW